MARKVDDNQNEVVSHFRGLGCHVAITSNVGKGFPDIVVSYHGVTVLVEIKDGSKPPSARKLTKAEDLFRVHFQGWYEIVESIDDATVLVNRIRKRAGERFADERDTDRGREDVRPSAGGGIRRRARLRHPDDNEGR